MTVVLCWDIDGTLLSTARAGVVALEDALRTVCGLEPDLTGLDTAGLTDAQVADAAIRHCGGDPPDEEVVAAFLREYEARLPDRLPLREGHVLPGVEAILADLHDHPEVLNLLLTGNTAAGAAAKLRHYRLDRFFDAGAFCEGPGAREEIAARAVRTAAERLGAAPDLDRTYVIGDTPFDVRCGRAIGARTIAVASGGYEEQALREEGAWRVWPRLPDPVAFRDAVGIAGAPS